MKRHIPRTLSGLMIIFGLLLHAQILRAQELKGGVDVGSNNSAASFANQPRPSVSISFGKVLTYRFKSPVTRVSIGNPNIADVLSTTATELQLLGKKYGSTNLTAWYRDGTVSSFDIFVGGDTNYVQSLLSHLLPGENKIQIIATGEAITLSGVVKNSSAVHKAVRIAEEATGKKVLNMLSTEDLPQVLLEVKIAEVNRTLADSLGFSALSGNFAYNILGGSPLANAASATAYGAFGLGQGSTQAFLQANESIGLIKILAEPNIMAISGQEGNFLSGGTVYLPIPQSSSNGLTVVTLTPVPYGIGVKFTPTVLDGEKINLRVAPQVSDVSATGLTISAGGQTVVAPQIKSRSASTTVQLADGQTLAIGGLISNNTQESIAAFPWLASLPIIGPLFRNSSFNTQRSELIILVTPRIVTPLNAKPATPVDNYVQPTSGEFFYKGRLEGAPSSSKTLEGQGGVNEGK